MASIFSLSFSVDRFPPPPSSLFNSNQVPDLDSIVLSFPIVHFPLVCLPVLPLTVESYDLLHYLASSLRAI